MNVHGMTRLALLRALGLPPQNTHLNNPIGQLWLYCPDPGRYWLCYSVLGTPLNPWQLASKDLYILSEHLPEQLSTVLQLLLAHGIGTEHLTERIFAFGDEPVEAAS